MKLFLFFFILFIARSFAQVGDLTPFITNLKNLAESSNLYIETITEHSSKPARFIWANPDVKDAPEVNFTVNTKLWMKDGLYRAIQWSESGEDGNPEYIENSWDGEKSYTYDKTGNGVLYLTEDISKFHAMLMSTYSPYLGGHLFLNDEEQKAGAFGTTLSFDKIIENLDLSKFVLTENLGRNGYNLSADYSSLSYQLFFPKSSLISPSEIVITYKTDAIIEKISIKEWHKYTIKGKDIVLPEIIHTQYLDLKSNLLAEKTIHHKLIKYKDIKWPDEGFSVDVSKARYFVDEEKGIQIDTKTGKGMNLNSDE